MEKYNQTKVYIISGPASVGKTTIAKTLAGQLSQSAYISGDQVSHMHIGGRAKPWKSKRELVLIWYNILSLTKNFVMFNIDIVIDYVTFPNEARWLYKHLKKLSVEISYIVLWADQDTLLKRDKLKLPEHQMNERCLILHNEFLDTNLDKKFYFDTTSYSANEVSFITNEIMTNRNYILD